MSMFSYSLGQLVVFVAFALLTHAFFSLSERSGSSNAKFAAIGFGYAAIANLVQLVAGLSPQLNALVGVSNMSSWNPMFWLLYGIRPWVLLAAAVFAWRSLQGAVLIPGASPADEARG